MSKLSEEDARYHLDRCIKSGLWVPDANKARADEGAENEGGEEEKGEKEEETYENVDWYWERERANRQRVLCVMPLLRILSTRTIEKTRLQTATKYKMRSTQKC